MFLEPVPHADTVAVGGDTVSDTQIQLPYGAGANCKEDLKCNDRVMAQGARPW